MTQGRKSRTVLAIACALAALTAAALAPAFAGAQAAENEYNLHAPGRRRGGTATPAAAARTPTRRVERLRLRRRRRGADRAHRPRGGRRRSAPGSAVWRLRDRGPAAARARSDLAHRRPHASHDTAGAASCRSARQRPLTTAQADRRRSATAQPVRRLAPRRGVADRRGRARRSPRCSRRPRPATAAKRRRVRDRAPGRRPAGRGRPRHDARRAASAGMRDDARLGHGRERPRASTTGRRPTRSIRETTNRGIQPFLFLYGTPEWAAEIDGRTAPTRCSVYPPRPRRPAGASPTSPPPRPPATAPAATSGRRRSPASARTAPYGGPAGRPADELEPGVLPPAAAATSPAAAAARPAAADRAALRLHRAAADHAPGRSGTSRTRPSTSPRRSTSAGYAALAARPRPARSARSTRAPRSCSAACGARSRRATW